MLGKYLKFESSCEVENEIYFSKLLFFQIDFLANIPFFHNFAKVTNVYFDKMFREDVIRQVDFSVFTSHVF